VRSALRCESSEVLCACACLCVEVLEGKAPAMGLWTPSSAHALVEQGPVAVEQGPVAVEQGPVAVEQGPVAVEQGPVALWPFWLNRALWPLNRALWPLWEHLACTGLGWPPDELPSHPHPHPHPRPSPASRLHCPGVAPREGSLRLFLCDLASHLNREAREDHSPVPDGP